MFAQGHLPELIIILILGLVILGPGKLPQVGGAVGKTIREFRKASTEPDAEETPAEADKAAKATPVATITTPPTVVTSAPAAPASPPTTAAAPTKPDRSEV
jgi:sec-independent protein translocase protein TatA